MGNLVVGDKLEIRDCYVCPTKAEIIIIQVFLSPLIFFLFASIISIMDVVVPIVLKTSTYHRRV